MVKLLNRENEGAPDEFYIFVNQLIFATRYNFQFVGRFGSAGCFFYLVFL